ncbi:hypothetical protein EK904_002769 [Melospiza melodia maxima]|nr:hypothetical protein EK904_002769 [Melospiza melodia maxima]
MNWVTAEPVPNEPFYREPSVKALEEEIQLLKQELIMQVSLLREQKSDPKSRNTSEESLRKSIQQEEELENRLWNKYGMGFMPGAGSISSSDLRMEEAEEEQEEEEEEEEAVPGDGGAAG